MTTVINDLEKVTLAVSELNAAGNAVPISGVPVWTTSNEGVATVLAAPDGLSAVVTSVAAGSAVVGVTVDGLAATEDMVVQTSPGVKLAITASAPEPK